MENTPRATDFKVYSDLTNDLAILASFIFSCPEIRRRRNAFCSGRLGAAGRRNIRSVGKPVWNCREESNGEGGGTVGFRLPPFCIAHGDTLGGMNGCRASAESKSENTDFTTRVNIFVVLSVKGYNSWLGM